MRRGTLPYGGHDKVILKRSRDLSTRHRDNVTPRHCGDLSQRCYWEFHLGLRRVTLMERRGYVLLRRLGDAALRSRCVFHLRFP